MLLLEKALVVVIGTSNGERLSVATDKEANQWRCRIASSDGGGCDGVWYVRMATVQDDKHERRRNQQQTLICGGEEELCTVRYVRTVYV
jgi:hypothetical protein